MKAVKNQEARDVNLTQHEKAVQWQPDEVFAWRRAQLMRSGFPEPLAERVARDSRYDLHRLIELAGNGCPPELALRVLAPLEEDEELLRALDGAGVTS
jgi:hypothetical protein